MSPTRRDLFRRAAATVATASIAALPALPVAAQTPRLAEWIDTTDRGPRELGTFAGVLFRSWEAWSSGQREHFLGVIEREFPDFGGAVVEYLEWSANRPG